MKVTADTITDAQIRELRELGNTPLTGNGFVTTCDVALYDLHTKEGRESQKYKARARCAEIWNARHAKDGGS